MQKIREDGHCLRDVTRPVTAPAIPKWRQRITSKQYPTGTEQKDEQKIGCWDVSPAFAQSGLQPDNSAHDCENEHRRIREQAVVGANRQAEQAGHKRIEGEKIGMTLKDGCRAEPRRKVKPVP